MLSEKKRKMDTDEPQPKVSSASSYQLLNEGVCETVFENKQTGDKMNITELLRDLYSKLYKLTSDVRKLQQMAGTLPQ